MKTSQLRNSVNRSPLRRAFFLIPLALALGWFALPPVVRAVDPPPDGGYPGENTAEGEDALFSLTTGSSNTANGFQALFSNTAGSLNTANGASALRNNTTGNGNTANGVNALFSNTTGFFNTANGLQALFSNTTGNNNTANGFNALHSNTTGGVNTANGLNALFSNTTGSNNTANGFAALFSNTTGNNNTANGALALESNTTGTDNTANGPSALFSNTTGSNNLALGATSGFNLTTGDNNIDIGNAGVTGESGIIRIGTIGTHRAAVIAGISTATIATGVPVFVNHVGRLGIMTSSTRYKDAIKPMDKASEAILALQPVTFRYKHELDPDGIPQFGLVAEQVEKVNPDLVARDDQGKACTVRYEAVNAMLLNEFLKEHRKVEELEATVAKLQSAFKAQAALIQEVSEQLEVSKPAQQMVADNH